MKKHNLALKFITILKDQSDQRIDNFLKNYLKDIPISKIYHILRNGDIRVNKNKIKPKYKLRTNDIIRIPPLWKQIKKKSSIINKFNKIILLDKDIIYEDNFLLILNKPSGIAVHGGSGINFGIIESIRILRPNLNFLELVHRLDRETSGILLIAKKRSTLKNLHEQLRLKKIKKKYLALVQGQWNPKIKLVSVPIIKKYFNNKKNYVKVDIKGKQSKTFFKIYEKFNLATLMIVTPITGRTHQIRVHSKYVGHPIMFDDKYGDQTFDKKIKMYGANRLFLHALSMHFIHPNTGKFLKIEAKLSESLNKCLIHLRKNFKINN